MNLYRVCGLILRHDRWAASDEESGSQTPLHMACTHGHEATVRVLLDAGAPKEARDCNLWTPLGCAARNGHYECVRVLLEDKYGVQIDPEHPDGDTPLMLAAMSGSVKTVNLLIEKGASLMGGERGKHNVLTIAILNSRRLKQLALSSTSYMTLLIYCQLRTCIGRWPPS